MRLVGDAAMIRRLLILHYGTGSASSPVHIEWLHLCVLPYAPSAYELQMEKTHGVTLHESSLQVNSLHYLVDRLYLDLRSAGTQPIGKILCQWNPVVFSMCCVDPCMQQIEVSPAFELRLQQLCLPALTFGCSVDPITRFVVQCLAQKHIALECVTIVSHALLPDTIYHTYLFDDLVSVCDEFGIDLCFRCPLRRWTFDGLFADMLRRKQQRCRKCSNDRLLLSPFLDSVSVHSVTRLMDSNYFERLCANRLSSLVAAYWTTQFARKSSVVSNQVQ